MTFRTKFLLFVSICVPPNNLITACGATSFPGYHSFPKWAIWTMIIMVNGNYSMVLKYTISAGMLSLKVTSTKMIWQSLYIYRTPLCQKFEKIWLEIRYDGNITSTLHLLSLPLWQNSLVRIGNKPIYYKSWSSKRIRNVRHLMKDADNFLSFTELKERFDVKTK